MNPRTDSRRARGFSLVEIMVAMALGLILLAGTIQIYASSKASYRLQESTAALQENGRYAIHILRQDVLKAGFPRVNNIVPFVNTNATPTADGGAGQSDQFTISYLSTTDCLGNNILNPPAPTIALNHYFIDANNNLACLGNGNNTPQPLVEGIDNMQVLYGLDEDADGVANRYVNAGEVQAGVIDAGTSDWDKIVSLRIALLVSSMAAVADAKERDFELLDAAPLAKDDAMVYRVFTTTIPLRNRTP